MTGDTLFKEISSKLVFLFLIGFFLTSLSSQSLAQDYKQGAYTAIPIQYAYEKNSPYTSVVMIISPSGHVWYVDTTDKCSKTDKRWYEELCLLGEGQLAESTTTKKW